MHFKQVESPFGFLYLDTVEKNGKIIPKSYFSKAGFLQKNSLLSKWSQFNNISAIMQASSTYFAHVRGTFCMPKGRFCTT